MDGSERGIGSGGECCGLFCFAFTFAFIFALTFSSRESGGLASEGVSLPLRLPLPLPCPFLCFSDPHRVDPVSFRSFHEDRSLGKHNIQMGLPEGHSVLLHFSHNGRAYQAVLVSMSSAPSKSKKGEHAMWKHVLPVSTDFAWLPNDVADALCSLALHQDPTRPYGSFHEMQLGFNEHYQASLHIEGLWRNS